jgi:hypothetical protein
MGTAEAPDQLRFGCRCEHGISVVRVTGEIDIATCGLLRSSACRSHMAVALLRLMPWAVGLSGIGLVVR